MTRHTYRERRSDPTAEEAVRHCGSQAEKLLPILQQIHAKQGEISQQALGAVADRIPVSDAQAQGVATFYSMLSSSPPGRTIVRICDGPACCLRGAEAICERLELQAADADCCVQRASCLGLCDRAPAALVAERPCGPLPLDLQLLPTAALPSEAPPANPLSAHGGPSPLYENPRSGELRIAMKMIGRPDPEQIDAEAYHALKSAIETVSPAEVIETISQSGLQGRGGAGFPTGRKWELVARAEGSDKVVVCNADESEPATFKDRVLLEGDPHLVLEGILLAAYAVGASQAVIYIRGEYEFAARRLERAIVQAERSNLVGERILGSDFSCRVELHRGAGAYICGEETALLESLEGRRGEPRIRPPYPATQGLFGKPTVVNNVETLCKTPAILLRGAAWYRSLGTRNSPGTKLFTICGDVEAPGVVEVPFGVSLRQLIDEFAGGMRDDSNFHMALTGGAAGNLVDGAALDDPLDFAISKNGATLGSGAMLVVNDSVTAPQLLSWLLRFFVVESCGKCTPCREGTWRAKALVERFVAGGASHDDLKQLRRVSRLLRNASLCGLGQSAAWPIDSALLHFAREFSPITPRE